MNTDKLNSLNISPDAKKRPQGSLRIIFVAVIAVVVFSAYLAWPRASDAVRVKNGSSSSESSSAPLSTVSNSAPENAKPAPSQSSDNASPENPLQAKPSAQISAAVALKVSGYIINRERIELSPRFLATVKWIGVKKGDTVTNGQVVVLLDDAEYAARLHEAEGRVAGAKIAVEKSQLDFERMVKLNRTETESRKSEDDSRLALESAKAALSEAEGARELAKTYLDWTVIHSPINGVVMEKLVQPNELVQPQSFGGGKGPSTALLAVADPKDLQVEVDLSEADLSKVVMRQKCRVIPEAYPDRVYEGQLVEISPQADRQKGTLQVKVQIHEPDRYLTPQLSATVEFLKE